MFASFHSRRMSSRRDLLNKTVKDVAMIGAVFEEPGTNLIGTGRFFRF